jgi:hypothetical protein
MKDMPLTRGHEETTKGHPKGICQRWEKEPFSAKAIMNTEKVNYGWLKNSSDYIDKNTECSFASLDSIVFL